MADARMCFGCILPVNLVLHGMLGVVTVVALLYRVLCCMLHLVLLWVVFWCSALLRVSGHEAHEVHRADCDVEISQKAEKEGETLATCNILRSIL